MANRVPNYSTRPKRRIEKVRNLVYHQSTNAVTSTTLHTAEDSKTLVRMRGRLTMMHDDATDESFHATISVYPAGVAVYGAPGMAEVLDSPCPSQFLVEWVAQSKLDGDLVVYEFDSKAQRKLKENDVIKLRDISGGADAWFLFGEIEMWFKE